MSYKKQKIFFIKSVKDNSQLGIIHFYESSEIIENEYSVEANLNIEVKFTAIDGYQYNSNFFSASYVARKSNNIITRSQASISSTSPYNKGAIFVDPSRIRGNRLGSLVMSHTVKWISQFPIETVIKEIDFMPDNYDIAKNFYTNFGIPINGKQIRIKDLIDNENWKKNIHEVTFKEFARLDWQRQEEIKSAKIKSAEIKEYMEKNQRHSDLYSYRSIFFGLPTLKHKLDSIETLPDIHQFNSYYNEFYSTPCKENILQLIQQYAEMNFSHQNELNKLEGLKKYFKINNLNRVRRIKFDYLLLNLQRFLLKNIVFLLITLILLITYFMNA